MANIDEVTRDIFNQADKDGSGALDRDEFKGVIARLIAEHGLAALTDAQIDQEFTTVDTDGNGLIDLSELRALVTRHMG